MQTKTSIRPVLLPRGQEWATPEIDETSPFGQLIQGCSRNIDATLVALGGIYHAVLDLKDGDGDAPDAIGQSPVFSELVAAINKQTEAIEGLKKTQGEQLAVLKAIRDRPTAKKTAAETKAEG